MNNTNSEKTEQGLTPNQIRAIKAILECKTYSQAIKRANIGKTSLYAWLKNPAFKNELDRQLKELSDHALDRLKASTTEAVDVLIKTLKRRNPHLQLKSAKSIMDYFLKIKELQEFDERLSKLEEVVQKERSLGTL